MGRTIARVLPVAGGVIAAGLVAYLRWLRPWQLRWGATDAELARPLPGDAIVPRPTFAATRAVTIAAPPEDVWPWIAQIGCTRAGMYSLDWLDNGRQPSAERIIPELQRVAAGDFVPLTPDARHGMWVRAIEPGRFVLWAAEREISSWLWWLEPLPGGRTRLLTRLRVRYDWRPPWVFYFLLQDAGDIVMMRHTMLGIRRRAERASHLPLAGAA